MQINNNSTRSLFDASSNKQSNLFLDRIPSTVRFDNPKYKWIKKFYLDQLGYFWKPEEFNLTKDRGDFNTLQEHEKRIFLLNLKYQIELDSVQSIAPGQAFKPFVSDTMLGQWITIWEAMESIHAYSYSYIIQQLFGDSAAIFDSIAFDKEILARASSLVDHYNKLVNYTSYIKHNSEGELLLSLEDRKEIMKHLYLTLISVYCLEGIRFYLSFACSFNFAENKKMEGNSKVLTFIARDEALHFNMIKHIINTLKKGDEGNLWVEVIATLQDDVIEIFESVRAQERRWAEYLFQDGPLLGLNYEVASMYLDYLVNDRARDIGYAVGKERLKNPLPWMSKYLGSKDVQPSPQETELASYVVGSLNVSVDISDLDLD